MVDPLPVADCEVYDELAALLDLAGSDAAGPVAITRLVERTVELTAATGVGFVELGSEGVRLVAISNGMELACGHRVPTSAPLLARLLDQVLADGGRLIELDRDELDPEVGGLLAPLGLHRLVMAPAVTSGRPIGLLLLGYRAGEAPLRRHQRSLIALLATCAARMYPGVQGHPHARSAAERAADDNLFISVTSHELRTPVTVIRGYADTLANHWDQLEESQRRSAVSVIGQRARDLARLLDRLLVAAEGGLTSAEPAPTAPFDLVDALREATPDLPTDLRRDLRVSLPVGLAKAMGDRASIPTVLTELVTNARKYSPDAAEIELTAGADAYTVWFQIADRGIGIAPDHVDQAFERFWQSDSGDDHRYGGVGLGLYLVRRIVGRQNGRVSLRPRLGGGTVAEVRLPRADTSPGEA